MQRKFYNNFYLKADMDFQNFSDKSNDKFCEWKNKKKICNQLSTSNKIYDNYLDNSKERFIVGGGVCALSSTITKISGNSAAATASSTAFFYYGIAIVILIAVTFIIIYLFLWLRERRKNSLKHEYKKHLSM